MRRLLIATHSREAELPCHLRQLQFVTYSLILNEQTARAPGLGVMNGREIPLIVLAT
jgi:hypothetical protein